MCRKLAGNEAVWSALYFILTGFLYPTKSFMIDIFKRLFYNHNYEKGEGRESKGKIPKNYPGGVILFSVSSYTSRRM